MIRIDPPPISGSPDAELYTAAQSEMIKSFAELLYRSTTREITVDQSSYDKALACNFTYACTGRFEVRSLSITKQLRYDVMARTAISAVMNRCIPSLTFDVVRFGVCIGNVNSAAAHRDSHCAARSVARNRHAKMSYSARYRFIAIRWVARNQSISHHLKQ